MIQSSDTHTSGAGPTSTTPTSIVMTAGELLKSFTKFSLAVSLSFLTMAVIGGLHSRAGALLGGAYLAFAPEVLREFKDAQMVIYGVTLILCVQFLPGGLINLVDIAGRALRRAFHGAS